MNSAKVEPAFLYGSYLPGDFQSKTRFILPPGASVCIAISANQFKSHEWSQYASPIVNEALRRTTGQVVVYIPDFLTRFTMAAIQKRTVQMSPSSPKTCALAIAVHNDVYNSFKTATMLLSEMDQKRVYVVRGENKKEEWLTKQLEVLYAKDKAFAKLVDTHVLAYAQQRRREVDWKVESPKHQKMKDLFRSYLFGELYELSFGFFDTRCGQHSSVVLHPISSASQRSIEEQVPTSTLAQLIEYVRTNVRLDNEDHALKNGKEKEKEEEHDVKVNKGAYANPIKYNLIVKPRKDLSEETDEDMRMKKCLLMFFAMGMVIFLRYMSLRQMAFVLVCIGFVCYFAYTWLTTCATTSYRFPWGDINNIPSPGWLKRTHSKLGYPAIYRAWAVFEPWIMITAPSAKDELWVSYNREMSYNSCISWVFKDFFGKCLGMGDLQNHSRIHKMWAPFFTPKKVGQHLESLNQRVEFHLKGKRQLIVPDDLIYILHDELSNLYFGTRFAEKHREELHWFVNEAERLMSAAFGDPLVYISKGISKKAKEMSQAIAAYRNRLKVFIHSAIHEKKNEDGEITIVDVFDRQSIVTMEEFMDTLTESLFAPAHGTGATLGHVLIHLASHPIVQHRLRYDIMEGETKHGIDLDERFDAVLKESMRLRPIFHTSLPHRTTSDAVIAGVAIKKGTIVGIDVHSYNNNPHVYGSTVDQFWPERFEEIEDKKNSFNPNQNKKLQKQEEQTPHYFGLGFRRCMGSDWVRALNRILLKQIVSGSEIIFQLPIKISTVTSSFTSHDATTLLLL
jgi:cytochrome P450